MSLPDLILHIGAPKCGSSAVQTALSAQPMLTGANGARLRYVACEPERGRIRALQGRALTAAARRSPYGYVSWPNLGAEAVDVWAAFDKVVRFAGRSQPAAIISNEGWIGQAEALGSRLSAHPDRAVDAVAFLRPPLDWLNAAYWQWGIWSGLDFNRWVGRPGARYSLGSQVVQWARQPGIRLRVRPAQPDAVAALADLYDLDLEPGPVSNSSSPPALIGFLLRNRRFRPNPHDAAVEFVVQRWCRFAPSERLFAFLPRHIRQIRDAVQKDVADMLEAIEPQDAALLRQDERWFRSAPYHDVLERPKPDFENREALAQLHADLHDGLRSVSRAARRRVPALTDLPAASAPVSEWDEVVAEVLEALLEADAAWRLGWVRRKLKDWQASRS